MSAAKTLSLRTRLRLSLTRASDAVSRKFAYGRTVVTLEDGTLSFDDYRYRPHPRYGATKPPLEWLAARLKSRSGAFAASLDMCLRYQDDLASIPLTAPDDDVEPGWLNAWTSGLDAAWLYSAVRSGAPSLFLEIGSGNSTKFVRRAIVDGGLLTRITSIDPHPRADIDRLCDVVVRAPLEDVDLDVFAALQPGDILFFDGSHRAYQNSDVTVFFLEVLPRLPPGVLVAIHDIFLPFDYPSVWTNRLYNEQHMLAAYLLGRQDAAMEFAAFWISEAEEHRPSVETLFRFDAARDVNRHGGIFVFRS